MKRNILVLIAPPAFTLAVIGVVMILGLDIAVARGIYLGLILALLQTFISIALLWWAWESKIFYYVWGGGVLFRFLVFAGTAFVVYRYTELNLAAALLSLVTGTTVFLTFESATFLRKR